MSLFKKIVLILSLSLSLFADDIVVFENEYKVLKLDKKVKKVIVGNKEIVNISLLGAASKPQTTLKLFGKKSGNTSILLVYRDKTIQNYHVYVNQNLGFVEKMINVIEPDIQINRVGDGSTVIIGKFSDPHQKKRVYELLKNAGVDMSKLMDITATDRVDKMIRTKLYLVEINNNRAKDLGGVTGLGYFGKYADVALNPDAVNGATFSGWLLDNVAGFTSETGHSVVGTLNFLQTQGIAKILDDTVLITTEDKNASFHVGGDVYIPIGVTQTNGGYPTINLEEKEYGLRLTLKTEFMEKDGFMHLDVDIVDSEFDPNKEHYVNLGGGGTGLFGGGTGIEVPSFLSKDISTDIVAKHGQLIALGGRLHTEEIESEEKIPILGDIPLLGSLFTHTVSGLKKNDLLFFLVPEIVDANEDIDDSHFYRDFKNESDALHAVIQDMNASDEMVTLIEVSDNNSSQSVEHIDTVESSEIELSSEEEGVSELLIEDENLDQNEAPKKEILKVQEEDEVYTLGSNAVVVEDVSETEEKELTTTLKEESQKNPVKSKTEAKTEVKSKKYQVTTTKIFLRTKPSVGKRSKVWIKGHSFIVDKEEEVNGSTWLRVSEDCFDKCIKLEKSLWISKKYTEEI